MNRPDYRFVPVTRADYPMLRAWLAEPHIGGWWGDPDTEIALIEEDLENGPTDMRIVRLDGKPFAFVQDYPAHHWPAPQFDGLPAGARAMDTFLGDPAFIGQGHAARYLRQRAQELLAAGAEAVVVDPDPDNTRAVASYAGAGFSGDTRRACEDGALVRVMVFGQGRDAASRRDRCGPASAFPESRHPGGSGPNAIGGTAEADSPPAAATRS